MRLSNTYVTVTIAMENRRYRGQHLSGVVIAAVDSMTPRKDIGHVIYFL